MAAMDGILGKKLGMTQIYADDGTVIPVTVIQAGPCLVVQRKTVEQDGYEAVQIGLVEERPAKKVGRPLEGHFKKAGIAPTRRVVEFTLGEGEDAKPGDSFNVTMFAEKDYVDVIGTSKGKGFQGVMKRHGFAGGRSSHGSMFHRAPGSIGSSAYPSRVYPGMRGTGRMGGKRITTKNLQVVKVDPEQNLLYIRGAVPGPRSGYLQIRRAKRA
jgi:large subunit ribosomal protein L3